MHIQRESENGGARERAEERARGESKFGIQDTREFISRGPGQR
jgi:hypothetical protein